MIAGTNFSIIIQGLFGNQISTANAKNLQISILNETETSTIMEFGSVADEVSSDLLGGVI